MRRGLEARRNRGPGSAVHSCALHRVRDTRALADEKFKARLAEMGVGDRRLARRRRQADRRGSREMGQGDPEREYQGAV